MSGRRPDPRAEPISEPPSAEQPASHVDKVFEPAPVVDTSPETAREVPQAKAEVANLRVQTPAGVTEPAEVHKVTADPRLDALERRVKDNDWRGIAKDLGPVSEIGSLPPNLGLLAALAHHEMNDEGDQEAVSVGVRCVASMLGVPEHGAMAGVIARRLFRKNPVRFRERQAPKARTSFIIVAVTLMLGGAVGWLSSGGSRTVMQLVHRVSSLHR
jgi:hypothetical protein